MRARTVGLLFFSQIVLVGLGAWAQVSGGAVWLLVMLVMLALTAALRLMISAESEAQCKPWIEENKCLKAISKMCVNKDLNSTVVQQTNDVTIDALQRRIGQLELELRLVCPPSSSEQMSGMDARAKE